MIMGAISSLICLLKRFNRFSSRPILSIERIIHGTTADMIVSCQYTVRTRFLTALDRQILSRHTMFCGAHGRTGRLEATTIPPASDGLCFCFFQFPGRNPRSPPLHPLTLPVLRNPMPVLHRRHSSQSQERVYQIMEDLSLGVNLIFF